MDVQFLVTTECMSVTSAMRKNSHWVNAGIATILGGPASEVIEQKLVKEETSLQSTKTPVDSDVKVESESMGVNGNTSEASLVLNFSGMRQLIANKHVSEIDVSSVVKPFLEVIKSALVSGHITSLALTSIEKFITLDFITLSSVNAAKCCNEIANALAKCKFEAFDRANDDLVILQLMHLTSLLFTSELNSLLTSKSTCKLFEACMASYMQPRRTEIVRKSVLTTLNSIAVQIFRHLESNEEHFKASTTILTLLTSAVNPEQLRTTNTIRISVIHLLKTCLEVSNKNLRDDQVAVLKTLWKHLAQLVRTNNHPVLVRETLMLVAVLMNTIPEFFKLEFQFILLYLLTSLTPLSDLPRDEGANDMFYAGIPNRPKGVKSAPIEPGSNILTIPTAALTKTPETREAMVEVFATLAAACPTLFIDLYINYDCDLGSIDLCEDLMGFLCRNAYPDSATWSTSSVPPLCLEAVLSGLNALVMYASSDEVADSARSANSDADNNSAATDAHVQNLLRQKLGKSIETQVAETFNQSTSKGIADMVTYKLIASDSPKDIANFLLRCKKLNKAVLGKYFAKSENKEVLENYVKGFDFKGLRIDEALRLLLCSFRLPGESAQIENLLQKFADHYISYGDKVEDSSDSAFILAYAVLMLNTDHYSPTLKRRMDYEAFFRNVKGVNRELPDEYIKAIFDGITSQEIVMPEEHDTDETFEHSWRESVLGLQPSDPYIANLKSSKVTRAIFETSWKPLVSTLSFVFATATDDLVFKRVITGFQQLAILATKFKSKKALNHIIACLSQISALSSGDLSFPNNNLEVKIEDIKVIVSDLSTQFGGDLKAQMASITLFSIVKLAGPEIGEGAFSLITKCLANLYIYGLITESVIGVEPVPNVHTFERSKAGKAVGIFSALSNYLTSSSDTPAEPSDENVDAALGAADCIKSCNLDDLIINLTVVPQLSGGALQVLPNAKDKRYIPAQRYILKLLNYCARDISVRERASQRAFDIGHSALALQLASETLLPKLLHALPIIDKESQSVLLSMTPSVDLCLALSKIENPDESCFAYVVENLDSITPEMVKPLLKLFRKHGVVDMNSNNNSNSNSNSNGINALGKLAVKFREHHEIYLDILAALGSFTACSKLEMREDALSLLQNEFLQDDLQMSWAEIVNKVLIPEVLDVILKPEVYKRDPRGMIQTRQQVASLIGKVFLHLSLSMDSEESDKDLEAWINVLKSLDRLLSTRRQPVLEESVIEMLKNVMLVTKHTDRGSQRFYSESENVLKGFLPSVAEILNQSNAPKEPKEPEVPEPKAEPEEKKTREPETAKAPQDAPETSEKSPDDTPQNTPQNTEKENDNK